ncbi:hypothetical protein V6N11_034508, partial [Hibiscus sabdariffa]
RKRVNRISALQRDDGVWYSEEVDLKKLATKIFRTLFTSSSEPHLLYVTCGVFLTIKVYTRDTFLAPISTEEIHQAVFSMDASKSPGIDSVIQFLN